ncbi:MAG: addiction module toxin, HicA family [candidate division Zixibacteria bacterium]|nr:addiction module toxin, HicA family [candidate division Zixibacteria bacterium]
MDRVLRRLGFDEVRRKGSHVFYRHADGRTTTAPDHKGRDVARPLLREILREVDLPVDDFVKELKR